MPKTPKLGRLSSSPRGQKVSTYLQVVIRLPHTTKATLDALSGATPMPVWQLIDQAVDAYIRQLSPAEQKLVAEVSKNRARQGDSAS